MAIAWSRISSKVIAHPPYADGAYRRRCRNKPSCSRPCIPHIVDKRKQEVREAHDAEVTPFSQMRGGMRREPRVRLHPPKIHSQHRSTPCPSLHNMPKNTPKPDSAGAPRT